MIRKSTSAPFLLLVLIGCDQPGAAEVSDASAALDQITSSTVRELEEPPEHPLGDIGFVVETEAGLAVSDALGPELRLYGTEGELRARYHAFGEGPFEFVRIGGLAVAPDGRLTVVDPRQGRVTVFESGLTPDTLFSPRPPPRGLVHGFQDGFVAATSGGDRRTRLSKLSGDWAYQWSVPAPSPGSISEYPYWGSLARTLVAAGAEEVLMAYSFLYTISVVDADGALTDSVRFEAPGFREASVPEAGEFSGLAGQDALDRWLASFDVISRLDIVADSLLVVTRGRIRSGSSSRFITDDTAIDVFRLEDLSPIWWNVQLPEGSRVVGAGDRLHGPYNSVYDSRCPSLGSTPSACDASAIQMPS